MPSHNIKRDICNAIASYLSTNVAGLSGRVSSRFPGPETETQFPSAMIETSRFMFWPDNPDEVYAAAIDDGKVVMSVGEFAGDAELRVYAKTVTERETIEQRIMDLFLGTQDGAGTLYIPTGNLTVAGYPTLHSVEVKCRIDSADWQEEFAFENRRYSFIDLTFGFPALVARNAHTIDSLQTKLAELEDVDGSDGESVEIQNDGSIEKP